MKFSRQALNFLFYLRCFRKKEHHDNITDPLLLNDTQSVVALRGGGCSDSSDEDDDSFAASDSSAAAELTAEREEDDNYNKHLQRAIAASVKDVLPTDVPTDDYDFNFDPVDLQYAIAASDSAAPADLQRAIAASVKDVPTDAKKASSDPPLSPLHYDEEESNPAPPRLTLADAMLHGSQSDYNNGSTSHLTSVAAMNPQYGSDDENNDPTSVQGSRFEINANVTKSQQSRVRELSTREGS